MPCGTCYLNLAFLTSTSSPHFFTYSYFWFLLITTLTFRMFDTGETLEDIERWAEATFPHDFNAVKDYLRDNNIVSEDCGHEDENTLVRVRSVRVGPRAAGHYQIIAHITSEHYDTQPWVVLCLRCEKGDFCGMHHHIIMTNLIEPFCWLDPGVVPVGLSRFEALIGFICPPSAMAAGASFDVRDFKGSFEGACRVIARKLEGQRRPKGKCK